jgi:hypothetical protein
VDQLSAGPAWHQREGPRRRSQVTRAPARLLHNTLSSLCLC